MEVGDSNEVFEKEPQEHIQEILDSFEKGKYLSLFITFNSLIFYFILMVNMLSTLIVFDFHTL